MAEHRRLVVMRHGKAEQYHGQGDFERELTGRGLRDATAAGQFLAAIEAVPDHALVSAATRTRQTWEAVSTASSASVKPELSRSLYGAHPEVILEHLQLSPEGASTVVFVGHNPSTEVLAAELTDEERSEDDLVAALAAGFPTSALAVFEVETSWRDIAPGTLRLSHLYVARG